MAEFKVNTDKTTCFAGCNQVEAKLSDGSFVISWENEDAAIYAKRYSSSGGALGSEFIIRNTTNEGIGFLMPKISSLNNGGFVITYSSTGDKVYAKIYDSGGSVIGDELEFKEFKDYIQSIIGLDNGGFVATTRGIHKASRAAILRNVNERPKGIIVDTFP